MLLHFCAAASPCFNFGARLVSAGRPCAAGRGGFRLHRTPLLGINLQGPIRRGWTNPRTQLRVSSPPFGCFKQVSLHMASKTQGAVVLHLRANLLLTCIVATKAYLSNVCSFCLSVAATLPLVNRNCRISSRLRPELYTSCRAAPKTTGRRSFECHTTSICLHA